MKKRDTQIQEVQRVPNKMNPKRPTPRHIIIKVTKVKDKDRILKAVRERELITYKRDPTSLSHDLSRETFQARKNWHEIPNDEKQGPTTKITLELKDR